MKIILFISTFLCLFAANAVEIRLNYTPVANLAYQLDCVSVAIHSCSDQNYKLLWEKEFIKDDADRALIKAWAEVMNKYKVNATLAKSDLSIDLSHKTRIASFEAKNTTDYLSRLDLVMRTSDRIEISRIINHFGPRFESWWNKQAAGHGKKFVTATDALLKRKDIVKLVNQFVNFYEAELPADFFITLNLFFRPELVKESTSGQQLDNYAVSEFLINEDPKQRLDVVLHELCHFLFKSSESIKFASLKKDFSGLKTLQATGAHNIMNETLAAAFGNGIVNKLLAPKDRWEKYLAHSNSFYNNYYIDTGAKAIMPWLEEQLAEGKTLYHPDFIPTYVAKLNERFGNKLESPKVLLSYMYFIFDEKFKYDFENDIHKNIFSTQAWWGDWNDKDVVTKFKENPDVTGLIAVKPENLSKLTLHKLVSNKDLQAIKKHLRGKPAILYSVKKSPSAVTYIIVAKNQIEAVKQLERLGHQETGFQGLLKD